MKFANIQIIAVVLTVPLQGQVQAGIGWLKSLSLFVSFPPLPFPSSLPPFPPFPLTPPSSFSSTKSLVVQAGLQLSMSLRLVLNP